jgi:hypothetical protein
MGAEPPSIPPVTGGGLGHPGHFAGQGDPFDVAAIGDRLVAPGYTFPDFHAVTWSSTDRQHWSLAELPPGRAGAFGLGIATERGGTSVIVGRIENDAAAWWSPDGVTWHPADGGAAFVEAPETRMTAVAATAHGFVAGGWTGITNRPGAARFWTSSDGQSWVRVTDSPAFADGRVTHCCYDAHGDQVMGDLKTQTLAEIMAGDRLTAMQEAFERRDFSNLPRCGECFKHGGGEANAFNDVLARVQNLPGAAKDVVRKVIDVRYRT